MADAPRWQHRGAGALSDRDTFLMRTGSAFLKAELLPLAARRLLGREVPVLGPQDGAGLRVAGFRCTPRLLPAQPVAGAQLPPLRAVVSCCAAYSHIPARSVSLPGYRCQGS